MRKKKWVLSPKIKRKLDKLFSLFIHHRDKETCVWCNRKGIQMNCSHILPKEFLISRWLPDNAILLCVRCHRLGKTSFHQSPLHFVEFYSNHYGQDKIDDLLKLSMVVEFQWTQDDIERLTENLKITA